MKPYYDDGKGIQIWHADCREILPTLAADVLITDPPYPNNAGHFDDAVPVAREVISQWQGREAMIFWSELEHPPCGMPLVAVHIWHRTNVNGRLYEPIYHYEASGVKRRSYIYALPAVFGGVGPGCWEYEGHPTQKNLVLMERLVSRTLHWGTVIDPFMGSGTTLRAAKNVGRRAIGIEVNEAYCHVAVQRLQQEVLFTEATL